jgi:hypothetical protein
MGRAKRATAAVDGWQQVEGRRRPQKQQAAQGSNGAKGLCWRCPACGVPENWAERSSCRKCGKVPSRAERVAAEEATRAAHAKSGNGPRPGAAAPKERPQAQQRSRWADGPPSAAPAAAAASGAAAPKGPPKDKEPATGKDQVAALRRAAESLRAAGLEEEALKVDQRAAARLAEIEAERPINQRFKAADDLARRKAKVAAAAATQVESARAALAAAESELAEAEAELQAADAEVRRLRAQLAQDPEDLPTVKTPLEALMEEMLRAWRDGRVEAERLVEALQSVRPPPTPPDPVGPPTDPKVVPAAKRGRQLSSAAAAAPDGRNRSRTPPREPSPSGASQASGVSGRRG